MRLTPDMASARDFILGQDELLGLGNRMQVQSGGSSYPVSYMYLHRLFTRMPPRLLFHEALGTAVNFPTSTVDFMR